MRKVVITGMGTVNPLGCGIDAFWKNVQAGKCGISTIDKFDPTEVGVSVAGIVRDFEPTDYFDKKDVRHMERFTQFAVAAAKQAIDDCGSDMKDLDPYRCGVIIGCGIGGLEMTEHEHIKYMEKGPNRVSPFFVPMMISNMAAGEISMKTNFRGDNFATVTACASSTHAIGEAFRKIKDGYLDACICGGTESTVTEFTIGAFKTMKALTRETDPMKASTPFDKNRSGFVLGEGAGVLMLEEYVGTLSERGISLRWSEEAVALIASKAIGGKSGARDIRNTIRRTVEYKITGLLVEKGEGVVSGIAVVVKDGEIDVESI